VTTGPGSTNALSGIAGAWVDSVPVLVISGQVRRDIIADYSKLRQLGPQEINIEPMAKPVVKYFHTLMDPRELRRELECAWWHATTGRPGPVWINIPLDVQGGEFSEEGAPAFVLPNESNQANGELKASVAEVIHMLKAARRPVVIGGNGVHLGGAHERFLEFVERVGAPVLATTGGMDLLGETHPLCMGRFGPTGQRRANFTLQNSDLMITVGASMSISSIGFNTAGFAPKAKRIMVTIDPHETSKPNFQPHLAVAADAKEFFDEFLAQANGTIFEFAPAWKKAWTNWKERYPTVTPDYQSDTEHVNSYVFTRALSDALSEKDTVVTGNSLDIVSIIHSFAVRAGQRVFTNINYGSMGWDLPGAIGACVGAGRARTCLMTGDGSIQFNIQELMTIRANNLPIKIFVLNNDGYESIRATQRNFFEGRFVGSDFHTGIGNPDFEKLAAAYGFGYERIANNAEIAAKLPTVLGNDAPFLCELNLSPDQPRSPKTMSTRKADGTFETRPLEDMFPFLPREEIWENMHMFDETPAA
ncbi:MAG: thiamine pyrophosphate-binding protein, partial [Verrucomicrobiota bacterium]|nr:thiamine pyrophosphate-binding protein [Verrucomicrobiota bacterium]